LGGRGRQISGFEARVISKTVRATQRNPVSKKKKKKTKKRKRKKKKKMLLQLLLENKANCKKDSLYK
jgi:hypothetical protein